MRLEVYSGGSRRQDPSGAVLPALPAAGGAHGAGGKPRCNSALAAPGPPLSLYFSGPGGLPKALTPLRGVPPIHGGLTSDPARRKVFQLEAAHGRGRRATPARGRVGAHSACAGHGPRERRAGAGGGESERSTVRRRAGSPVPTAARAAALTSPPARRQLTARPQRSLKAQHAGGATARPAPPHSPGPEAPRPGEDSLRPPLYGDLSLASCRTSALRGEGAHSCL